MGIELSDAQLGEICTYALERVQASRLEYRRLLGVLREKLPSVTYDMVATTRKNLLQGTHHDDGQAPTHAAFCFAWYELAVDTTEKCVALLGTGQADGTVFQNLLWCTSGAFEALGALTVVLHGDPLAQSFIDQGIKQRAIDQATIAANVRHSPVNEAKAWVQDQWRAHGQKTPYNGNKSEFARQYVENVKAEYPGVAVTEKTIAEVWLSPAALN